MIVGTTGESPTVNVEEHCELIRASVEHAAGRVPVMPVPAPTPRKKPSNSSRFAKKAGAVAGLSVVPYYNRPTQEGLYRHFSGGSPKRSTCHCICTTCRGGRLPTFRTTPQFAWPKCRTSWASRMRPATSSVPAT